MKKYNKAILLVEEILSKKPSDLKAHNLLINFLVETNEYEKVKISYFHLIN